MENETKPKQKAVAAVNQFDVVLGRGKGATNRPGNVYLRRLASEHATRYVMASTLKEKTEVTRQMLAQIEAKGGRFLQSWADTNANGNRCFVGWVEASRDVVYIKVQQSIRDVLKSRNNRSSRKKKMPAQPTATSSRVVSEQSGTSLDVNVEDCPLQQPSSHAVSSIPEHPLWLQQQNLLRNSLTNPPADIVPTMLRQQPLSAQTSNMLDIAIVQRLEHHQLQQNHRDWVQQQQQGMRQGPYELHHQQHQMLPQSQGQPHELAQLHQLQQNSVHVQQQQDQLLQFQRQDLLDQLQPSAYQRNEPGDPRQQQLQELMRFKQKQQELVELKAEVDRQQRELDQAHFHLRNSLLVPSIAAVLPQQASPSLPHFQPTAGSVATNAIDQLRASTVRDGTASYHTITQQHEGNKNRASGNDRGGIVLPDPLDFFIN